MTEQTWSVVRGWCETPGAENILTYGVQCVHRGGVWTWLDVDVDSAVVQRLADRLNAAQPAPCHFADMVLDFIEENAAADF